MKVSKVAAATARRLFGLCQTGGRLDETKLRTVVARLIESKPRDYRAVLVALQRLTRLEADRRRVTVESAVALDDAGDDGPILFAQAASPALPTHSDPILRRNPTTPTSNPSL